MATTEEVWKDGRWRWRQGRPRVPGGEGGRNENLRGSRGGKGGEGANTRGGEASGERRGDKVGGRLLGVGPFLLPFFT